MIGEPTLAALVSHLADIPLFSGLGKGALGALAAGAQHRTYAPDDVLFHEGEVSPGLFVLESGYVKVLKLSIQGREQVLEFIGPSEAFNTVAVFAPRPSPASCVALEPSSAWIIPSASMSEAVRLHPEFAERVISSMADRLVVLVQLVADLSLRTVTGRLARLLLDEAESEALYRPRWLTVPQLAARLGTVPDVAQRALGRLASGGLIHVTRREIQILDRDALEVLSE
ncbi:MAG: Crp/Fnr family transcriptional regulator [Dehalococcoidia bacterium]|nr:Crp/Fnr family transcriptional regulator [Thermoflexaceae bacterium]